jgi:iron complex outermembrane receptor protein
MRIKGFFLSSSSIFLAILASPALAAIQPPAPADPNAQAAQGQAGPAAAADATTQTADEANSDQGIVVTGLRRSLQSARNIRRNSAQIIDSVVAEDIGKLPDLNTAETAARIPGVQVYRQGGEAQNVLVRGLPNFTTTYNGREIFTAETRVVALQDFPSSNIAALEVFKTSTADLVEPGLAGLINVRSRRPFDFTGAEVAGSVWGLFTRQGHKTTPNFNLLATDRWQTGIGEIGLLLNASLEQMQYLDAEISNTDFIADPTINGQHVRMPDIQRLYYRSGRRERPSVNAMVQWKPSQSLEFYGEFLWQGFRNQIDDHFLEEPLYGGQSYNNLTFSNGSNLVSGGTVVNPGGNLFSFQGGTSNRTDTFQYAGGMRFNQDRLHINLDVARTTSTFLGSTESIDRIWPGQRTVNFNLDQPSFMVTGINFTDPSAQIFQGLFEENQKSAGQDWQVRADATYDVDSPVLRNIQLGGRYTNRNAQRLYASRYGFLLPLGLNASTLPVNFDVFRGVSQSNGTFNWAAPTYDSIRNNVAQLRQFEIDHCAAIRVTDPNNGCQLYISTAPIVPATLFLAHETTWAGYGQLNLGDESKVSGVLGVRVNRIDTQVSGPTGIAPPTPAKAHTEFLPNASLRWRIDPSFQLRLAVAKTITRPDFAQLSGAVVLAAPPPGGIGTPNSPYGASSGNPTLQPYRSWNYDAALEYYFAPAGFASLTVFHRSVNGFIQNQSFRVTDPALGVVEISHPINTGKGRITGVEFQAQTFFDFDGLPEFARGFGVQANVTYIEAKTQQDNGQGGLAYFPITDQLNGVSKWNYNLIGMYERHGFTARLTYSGRSSFAATRQYRGDDIYLETAHPAGRLDLSLNYNVLSNATIFADWTNITRTPFSQDFSSARAGAPRADYVRYLRYDESTLSLGFRFRFGS